MGGRVKTIKIGQGGWNGSGVTAPTANSGALRSQFIYDKMGRQIRHYDYTQSGQEVFDNIKTYNAKGQVINDNQSVLQTDGKTQISNSFFFYRGEDVTWAGATPYVNNATGSAAGYALGQVTRSWTHNHTIENGSQTNHNPSETAYNYTWRAGAELSSTYFYKDVHARIVNNHEQVNKTHHYRDPHGTLDRAYIRDGLTRNVYYKTDIGGQVIERNEIVPGKNKRHCRGLLRLHLVHWTKCLAPPTISKAFKPYDPNSAIGDTSPTAPELPKGRQ